MTITSHTPAPHETSRVPAPRPPEARPVLRMRWQSVVGADGRRHLRARWYPMR